MRKSHAYTLLLAGVALGFGLQPASAKVLVVTQGAACTSGAIFSTIQSAVSAASKGDVVAVCSGTYAEQVSITVGITLEGYTGQSVTVAVPAGGIVQNATGLDGFPIAAQILVQPALVKTKVIVKNLTVDGLGNNDQSCGLDLMGIYYQNAGGMISGNTVRNEMLPSGYQGCQDGQGIFVENQTAGTPIITVSANKLSNFDKNGITVHFSASNATITGNTVSGNGPIDYIAQNGIEVAYGATAKIESNTVSGYDYTPNTYGSAGILLYASQASNASYPNYHYITPPVVKGNQVSNSQYGVVLDAVDGTAGKLVNISGNLITGSQFAGIGLYSDSAVYISNAPTQPMDDDYINVATNNIQNTTPYDGIDACSDNNAITSNYVTNSTTESAIHLDGQCPLTTLSYTSGISNTARGNHLKQDCVGFLGLNLAANTFAANTFTDVTNQTATGTDSFSCSTGEHHPFASLAARQLQPVRY